MDYAEFYRQLLRPLEPDLGSADPLTITAIVGFDAGGPLSFCSFGRDGPIERRAYVSCELALRDDQPPSAVGRYELLAHCANEDWVRCVVSDIGRMSLDVAFDDGHSLDIGPWSDKDAAVQGVVFERACTADIEGSPFCVLRVIGITRSELEYAQQHGVPRLLARLREAGTYPRTIPERRAVV